MNIEVSNEYKLDLRVGQRDWNPRINAHHAIQPAKFFDLSDQFYFFSHVDFALLGHFLENQVRPHKRHESETVPPQQFCV